MQTTRERILYFLEIHKQGTAAEMSQVLNLTPANIRHHLNILESRGLIEIIGQNDTNNRGRPSMMYMLTKDAQDDALDLLTSAALSELSLTKSDAGHSKRLKSLATAFTQISADQQKSPTIRINAAIQRLTELKYKVHWEAQSEGPRIIIEQCPYAKIINRHPELCDLDNQILEHLTGIPCVQEKKISRTPEGSKYCQFQLSTK